MDAHLEQYAALLERAITVYGNDAQIGKTIEELSELITELARRTCGRFNQGKVILEYVDAYVMLRQLRMIMIKELGNSFDELALDVLRKQMALLRADLNKVDDGEEIRVDPEQIPGGKL